MGLLKQKMEPGEKRLNGRMRFLNGVMGNFVKKNCDVTIKASPLFVR